MKMIKIAIIGTGNIADNHIKSLLKFPERCKIVALVNRSIEKAIDKKNFFNLHDIQIFSSHEDLIKSSLKIDLVHICTPPSSHAHIATDCMGVGINVLVEKPMAISLEECDKMIEVERSNGVIMSVVAQNRFKNNYTNLKKLYNTNKAGKIKVAHIESLWWRGIPYYDLWWRGTWEKEGGGPTLNHAVHHIDLTNWIYGEMPKEVTAVMSNVMHPNSEVEDISLAILKYEDGSLAQITSSVVHHGSEQRFELQCENAKIGITGETKANITLPNGFPIENSELLEDLNNTYKSFPELLYTDFEGQIDNLLYSLETGNKPLITSTDGRNTIELITSIYKAAFTKQTVRLPIEHTESFYTFEGLLKNMKQAL
ncbi:MAG: Gfo/Idh/MocA family oxidoreductase [Defluviitaleaceae bacterium]|nr:Gfo/Idh/MocA family oxidoreductase [Defluviitaleaceae bacterium]